MAHGPWNYIIMWAKNTWNTAQIVIFVLWYGMRKIKPLRWPKVFENWSTADLWNRFEMIGLRNYWNQLLYSLQQRLYTNISFVYFLDMNVRKVRVLKTILKRSCQRKWLGVWKILGMSWTRTWKLVRIEFSDVLALIQYCKCDIFHIFRHDFQLSLHSTMKL